MIPWLARRSSLRGFWPLALLLVVFGSPALAEREPMPLTERDRRDLQRIERYLDQLTTVDSRFLQVSSSGGIAEGTLRLSRPGKLRIDYDPPSPIEIVADGTWLIYHDRDLEQVTSVALGTTPAGFLLRDRIVLSGEYTVTRLERGQKSIYVTVVQTDDPMEGSLVLAFEDQPLGLRKWTIVDAQGVATTVSLINPRFGAPLNRDLFEFEDPYADEQYR